MSFLNDKTAIIDTSTLEDLAPDNWEDQPSSNARALQEDPPTPKLDQQPMPSQKVEILRNKDKAKEAKLCVREERKEHLSMEDKVRRYKEARARIFEKDNKRVG